MITDKEQQALKLSPTKKDYYQVWNELLDTAKKLSNRWDPTSTNESDPGIILLKVLTAVTDKLNYNIDKNILEVFMPTAAQDESMRKLCDMMGYSIKYYQSAETDVTVTFNSDSEKSLGQAQVTFPKFGVVFTNTDKDVTYVSTAARTLSSNQMSITIPCIEGSIQRCESNNGNLIKANLIDDNHKYYLPETQIAENGIFISNSQTFDETWEKVDNLNTRPLNTKCFKFGFDSVKRVPYIQFPEDINNIIENGLYINYVRTSGANGNVARGTLTVLEKPASWSTASDLKDLDLTVDDFTVSNGSATFSGSNIETKSQAYTNYKRTIGTFDTLVTCRDYMNKIYSMTDDYGMPLVSNIIVSDIRDDINKAINICSFGEYGISYSDRPLFSNDTAKISNFDLILYPFRTVYNINASGLENKDEFKNSFVFSNDKEDIIVDELNSNKLISHNIRLPKSAGEEEVVCIKNFLKLNAKITTATKVDSIAGNEILKKIRIALYNAFNMRNLEFGEEIPFDSILEVISSADYRIKNVSLDEPILYTKFETADGKDYGLDNAPETYKRLYNKLALRNILAGRVKLFNYDEDISTSYNEKPFGGDTYQPSYPASEKTIKDLKADCEISIAESNAGATNSNLIDEPIRLSKNEVIQFRAPNYVTSETYPGYVNYYFDRAGNATAVSAIPATFKGLPEYFSGKTIASNEAIVGAFVTASFSSDKTGGLLFKKVVNNGTTTYEAVITNDSSSIGTDNTTEYYKLDFSNKLNVINNYVGGLYRKLPTNLDRVVGKFVDKELCKYIKITEKVYDVANSYYVPETHLAEADGKYTIDGLGRDGYGNVVKANTDYTLGDSILYIEYTPADKDGEESAPIVKKYTGAQVIKPNFDLFDSNYNNKTLKKSFPKTLSASIDNTITQMYTLGPNEQIEIRKPVEVVLDEVKDINNNTLINTYHLYWELKNDKELKDVLVDNKYTLQEGEYIYYTDINKTNMAYYGNGTEVIINGNFASNLERSSSAAKVSVEEILLKGIAIVPWLKVTLTGDNSITFKEYKYITLTEGCELNRIEHPEALTADNKFTLTNEWKTINTASYKLSTDKNFQELPAIDIEGATWEVRSKLDFAFGPNSFQTLNYKVASNNGFTIQDKITVSFNESDTDSVVLKSTSATKLLSVKSNYNCMSAETTLEVDNILKELSTENDFKITLFEYSPVTKNYIIKNSAKADELLINNVDNKWTKFTFSPDATEEKVDLNINIPSENHFGLMMIYFNQNTAVTKTNAAYLTTTDSVKPSLFNSDTWDSVTGNKYYLRGGINVVKIPSSCTLSINANATKDGKIIFGNLDLVKITEDHKEGINDIIDYYKTSEDSTVTPDKQLLMDIAAVDTNNEFYYNLPIERNMAIELNDNLIGDEAERLSEARVWYDYNNINNKFVISEIDADYLEKGIVIAKSSRQ